MLAAWSGLGYNRRALALQRAAAHVAAHGWPADLTERRASAPTPRPPSASFAWDRQEAAVDTNVRRVLARHDGVDAPPRELAERAGGAGPARPGGDVQPGDDGARRDRLPPAAARLRRLPGGARCRGGPWRVAAAPRERFEDTDRWARGRIVAALVAGEAGAGACAGARASAPRRG